MEHLPSAILNLKDVELRERAIHVLKTGTAFQKTQVIIECEQFTRKQKAATDAEKRCAIFETWLQQGFFSRSPEKN